MEDQVQVEVEQNSIQNGRLVAAACSNSAAHAAKDVIAITIEQPWLSSLERTLDEYSSRYLQDDSTPRDFPTIFKVPESIRSHDPKAYEPTMVSLGPYHHHKKDLQPMNRLKIYYLRKFLNRKPDSSLADYIEMIRQREREARNAYSEQVDMSSDYFVRLMLVDCCFVLEIITSINLVENAEVNGQVVDDDTQSELVVNPILSMPCSQAALARDMLLLENQLPLFLLRLLSYQSTGSDSILTSALTFLGANTDFSVTDFSGDLKEFHHFLHIVHYCMAPTVSGEPKKDGTDDGDNSISTPPPENVPLWQLFPSAVQLREAGIRFRKNKDPVKNFLCINFDKGKMTIPTLNVDDNTNILFRNLIAFEQCCNKYVRTSRHPPATCQNNYFTTYAHLMDCIVNTEDDVNLLQGKEIITDALGSGDEVALLFNDLCKGVIIDDQNSNLSSVFMSVKEHWNNKWNKRMAGVRHRYCSSPWAPISLLGVLILFSLTGLQTVYTVLSYYRS